MFNDRRSVLTCSIFALSLAVLSGPSAAQQVQGFCVRDGSDAVCDVRPAQLKQLKSVTASASGRTIDPASSVELFEKSSRTAAWYFLIQTSANPGDSLKAIERIVTQGGNNGGRRLFGVGAFKDKFEEKSPLGTPLEFASLQKSITYAPGDGPQLYRSANEALKRLAVPWIRADRKALVIFSDGRNNGSYSDRKALIDTAKDQNILIYNVYMAKRDPQGAGFQELESLKNESNGIILNAVDCADKTKARCATVELDESASKSFFSYLELGGQARFSTSANELVLNVTDVDGVIAQTRPVTVNAGNGSQAPRGWLDEAGTMVMQNPIPAAAAGVVALGALIILGTMFSRRSAYPAAGGGDGTYISPNGAGRETVILTSSLNPNPDHVYGWLQFLDADARRIPIGSTNVRIGRHRDNDIILQNKTVHRQHAVLHMSPDRRFSINDLGGENGTMVNSQRTTQRDLVDGDLIELGEVRLRFFANNT